jgi:ribosome maturation factor RimP
MNGLCAHFLFKRSGTLDDRLKLMIEPVVNGLGCELWGIEFAAQGNQSTLKIFIDSPDGIRIEDCERVSRQVSGLLDVEEPLKGKYMLEVSSPGMDRHLYTLAQFREYLGAQVKIRLRTAFEGRRNFTGILAAVEDGDVVLRVDEHEYLLPFDTIDRTSIIPDFGDAKNRTKRDEPDIADE